VKQVRLEALKLAVSPALAPQGVEGVLSWADAFVNYIETGERPDPLDPRRTKRNKRNTRKSGLTSQDSV